MKMLRGSTIVRSGPAISLLFVLAILFSHAAADVLKPLEAEARVAALQAEIARHDDLYFRRAAPEISDADYDQLKRELRALQERFPELAASGEVESSLGDDRSGRFPVRVHREPMLGLDKSYTESELRAFLERAVRTAGTSDVAFTVEPKYDGLAISLTYEHGQLVRAVTRGNGRTGDDVTMPLLARTNLPSMLRTTDEGPLPEFIELRGEVYMALSEFDRINQLRQQAGDEPFAHPRNLAVGTLRATETEDSEGRRLQVVVYGWGAVEPAGATPDSQTQLIARLRAWGLATPVNAVTVRTAAEVWSAVQAMNTARGGFDFPTDGVVVKVDESVLRRNLGATREMPLWAIAHKFPAERAETRLNAITVQVGRTGVLTPVAELAPVRLGGVTVTRASLHNRAEIARRDYRVGDSVYVERSGEVIPMVVGVNVARRSADSRPFVFPDECPDCRTPVADTPGVVAIHCPNSRCPAQIRRRVEHYASAACVDIRGLGPVTIRELVARGRLTDIADLYRLQRSDFLSPGSNRSKSVEQLVAAIAASKHAELWRVVHGLGLPDVGSVTAQKLAAHFGSLSAIATAGREELLAAGLGPSVATKVAEELATPERARQLREMIALGVQPRQIDHAGSLEGKIIVFTGTLPTLTREQAAERVRAAGGAVRDTVTRTTDYLVAGADGGRKLDDARRLAVPVLNEAEFLQLFEAR